MKIGFIGFGKMGSALAQGAIDSGNLQANQLLVYDPNPNAQQARKRNKISAAHSAQDVVLSSNFVFLCVKPQQMNDVLANLTPGKTCFVSIAAGIPLRTFEKKLGGKTPVIRVMPNTPALLRAGMSVMSSGKWVTPKQMAVVQKILSSVGEVMVLPEKKMDAVTALSGSGPAYVFYLAEAMMNAGKKLGLSPESAEKLTRQTICGAGLMLQQSLLSPENLRIQVTSKGGTTEAALKKFESHHSREIIGQGLRAAAKRSIELSRLF